MSPCCVRRSRWGHLRRWSTAALEQPRVPSTCNARNVGCSLPTERASSKLLLVLPLCISTEFPSPQLRCQASCCAHALAAGDGTS